MLMLTKTGYHIRNFAAVMVGDRILYANAYNDVFRIEEFDVATMKMVAPAEMPDNRVPGAKHGVGQFLVLSDTFGKRVRFYYTCRNEASGPFRLTFIDLPICAP